MKLFLDSAKLDEIKQAKAWGMLDGVTTNPSLIKAASKGKKMDMESYIRKILKVAGKLPVSLEVIGTNYEEMVREGKIIHKKFKRYGNVYVKIPVNPCLEDKCSRNADGIKAIRSLSRARIKINCTLIFTPEQSLLAAKAGAKFVSPFAGREDDYLRELNRIKFSKEDYYPAKGKKKLKKMINDKGIVSGVDLILQTRKLFDKQRVKGCEILAASIRNVRQFREVAEAGADIATLPLSVIGKLLKHEKSRQGMKSFKRDVVPEYARMLGRKK